MRHIRRFYRLVNILSLDIVAGAITGTLFFASLLQVDVLPYGIIAMGLTVWIIYTADHLRDAKQIGQQAVTLRHRFHQRYFNMLAIALGVALIADVAVLFFIRKPVFEWGVVLVSVTTIYLLIQRYLKFMKEVFVALIYTAGILLPSLSVTKGPVMIFHVITIAQFFLIAWNNLLIFSWFDIDNDRRHRQHSFGTIFGKSATYKCILVLTALGCLLAILQLILGFDSRVAFIFLLMNAVLFTVFVLKDVFVPHGYYRLLGDAVFFVPALYFL